MINLTKAVHNLTKEYRKGKKGLEYHEAREIVVRYLVEQGKLGSYPLVFSRGNLGGFLLFVLCSKCGRRARKLFAQDLCLLCTRKTGNILIDKSIHYVLRYQKSLAESPLNKKKKLKKLFSYHRKLSKQLKQSA